MTHASRVSGVEDFIRHVFSLGSSWCPSSGCGREPIPIFTEQETFCPHEPSGLDASRFDFQCLFGSRWIVR